MRASDQVRLFIAVSIPDHIRAPLDAAVAPLRTSLPQVRWVRPELWHLTLVFLGDRPLAKVEQIRDLVGQASGGITPVTVGIRGIGAFPDMRRPRVLWAGVEPGAEELETLQRAIRAELVSAGLADADDHFSAHLTLGRVRDGISPTARTEIGHQWSAVTPPTLPSFEAGEIQLMRSQLGPGGPRYSSLYSIPLGAPNTTGAA